MSFRFFRNYILHLMILFIIGLLSFEFYVFVMLHKEKRNMVPQKLVQDYETALCSFSMPRKPPKPSQTPCPVQGIVTTFQQGGLSSQMWQYANVLAISITTGLNGFIPACLMEILGKVFDNLSLPLLSEVGHCYIPLPDSVSSIEDWTSSEQSIVIDDSELCNDIVTKYLSLVRNHFVFNKALRKVVVMHLLRAKKNVSSATYIGVYIRKTAIVVNQEYDDLYPSVQFFLDAMDHFRKEFSNAVFIVIVDKKSFWKSVLDKRDVYLLEEKSLNAFGAPLALLAHCNHTILASNDFAVWGAILSGGKAIVSLCISENFNCLIQNYKTWNYLLNNTKSVNKFLDRLL